MGRKPHNDSVDTETVTRLKPKRHDVIVEALNLMLDCADYYELDQHTRDGLAAAVGKLAPPEKWGFVMLNPDQQQLVMRAIKAGPRPNETLWVWNACIRYIAYDRNGEIMAQQKQIAEAADISVTHTSTALSRLVDIGVLIRTGRGRFKVNPYVAWSGPLHKRELAAKDQRPVRPQLTVVEGGLSEAEIQAEQQRSQELKARAIAFLHTLDAETLAAWVARATQVGIPGMPPTTAENVEEWAFFVMEELQEQGLIP
jgi:hypothetical protein